MAAVRRRASPARCTSPPSRAWRWSPPDVPRRRLPGTRPPTGPLATALAKLAAVLGVDPDEAVSVALGETRPGVLDELRRAAAAEGAGCASTTTPTAATSARRATSTPTPVFAHEGAWYVRAYCHQAQDQRLFRVDRIVGVEVLLDETFDAPGPPRYRRRVRAGSRHATGDARPGARGPLGGGDLSGRRGRAGPRRSQRLAAGAARVSATPWLERLLVRLGPDVRVVDADVPGLADAGRNAARRILGRYRGLPAGGSTDGCALASASPCVTCLPPLVPLAPIRVMLPGPAARRVAGVG